MTPRWIHRVFAEIFGYFWLACPRCGRMFGGHEGGGGVDVIEVGAFGGWSRGRSTCSRCPGSRILAPMGQPEYRQTEDTLAAFTGAVAAALPVATVEGVDGK